MPKTPDNFLRSPAILKPVVDEDLFVRLECASLRQFHVYSDPKRDQRRHTASVVMKCEVVSIANIHVGDDAKAIVVIPMNKVMDLDLAFDHRDILKDFIAQKS